MRTIRQYYIAGPMRGIPEFNFPAFDVMAKRLRMEGHEVFSPAERDRTVNFDTTGMDGKEQTIEEFNKIGFDLRDALACDCDFICRQATHLFMLPGWSRSAGATAERALAIALGLEVEGAPV